MLYGPFASILVKIQQIRAQRKLERMFQIDNQVRLVKTGQVFQVYDREPGAAWLANDGDMAFKASWLSLNGEVRPDVLPRWELVRAGS